MGDNNKKVPKQPQMISLFFLSSCFEFFMIIPYLILYDKMCLLLVWTVNYFVHTQEMQGTRVGPNDVTLS